MSIIEKSVFVEPWGLGVRKGEPAFKAGQQSARRRMHPGEAGKIFVKWFGPGTVYDMKRDFKIEEIKG